MSDFTALSSMQQAHAAQTKKLTVVADHALALVNSCTFDQVQEWPIEQIENYLLLAEALECAGYEVQK